MALRPTQALAFFQVRSGIQLNLSKLARAQEQVATGKRILRPSDDAVGSSIAISLRRQAGRIASFMESIDSSRPVLGTGATELEQASALLTEARATVLQSMNGTLSPQDRESLADQLDLMRETLLGIGNTSSGGRFLFAGTETGTQPFEETDGRVEYRGNNAQQNVLIGLGVEIEINVGGADLFGGRGYENTVYSGLTGLRSGTSADSGSGYQDLFVRHDATTSALGAGLALAGGGTSDTIIGDHGLVVDAVAGTVRLGSGNPVPIPAPTSPAAQDVRVLDSDGSEVHLDFTGWTGVDLSTTMTGSGSISIDGSSYTSIDLSDPNLQLLNPDTGAVIHVDATGVSRAGRELVAFSGATNLFDAMAGIAEDLRNGDDIEFSKVLERIEVRLEEFDDGYSNLLSGLGQLGARLDRLGSAETRLNDVDLQLQGLISDEEDVDLSEVILEMSRAEQTLNVAQATGARLIQNTLLNYLR